MVLVALAAQVNNVPDQADLARDSIEREEAIRDKQRESVRTNKVVSKDCVDCEDPISEERQAATGGTNRCTDCQGYFDKREGR